MKKALFIFVIALVAMTTQAQIKMHNNGQVSLGTLSGAWNIGIQVYPLDCVHFNTQNTDDWHWVTVASPNAENGKCWIVTYPNDKYDHRFFVTGNGYIFKRGSWRATEGNILERIPEAGAVLDQITGYWYVPENNGNKGSIKTVEGRRPGVSAQEVKSVLPEAVTSDENGLLYVDYEALTVLLIETVKEQRQEIDLLRKVLEENGLMEQEK